jgi:hypothetical protein
MPVYFLAGGVGLVPPTGAAGVVPAGLVKVGGVAGFVGGVAGFIVGGVPVGLGSVPAGLVGSVDVCACTASATVAPSAANMIEVSFIFSPCD